MLGPWAKKAIVPIAIVCVITARALGAESVDEVAQRLEMRSEKLQEVDRFLEKQVADKKIAGAVVAIARKGKSPAFRVVGMMDLEAQKPMREDTIFRIYSMSKSITTAAALQLVEQGKMGLDDPVSKYIPCLADVQVVDGDRLRAPGRPITIKDLMLHTAGYSYGGNGPEAHKAAYQKEMPLQADGLAQMCERLAKIPLAHDPGADWTYSVSIDILGHVVEVVSGEPLDVTLEKNLFKPLGMSDTAFYVPADKVDRFAGNYRREEDGLKPIDPPQSSNYLRKPRLLSGGGGLVGTAGDYMRFLAMVHNGGEVDGVRLLAPESVRLMTSNQLPEEAFPIHFGAEIRHGTGFGLGFNVRTKIGDWDPEGHEGEFGWGGAASTHYWVSPQDDLIVATFEQIMPYQWDTEFGLKPILYEAVAND